MHIDLNSCFATIEQQANPRLRGKPVAVCAYTTPSGCILAPSVEAKRFGVKTGMRVKDGRLLCPGLIVLPSDPWKYRNVHLSLRRLVSNYTNDFSPKSIDEFVLNMENYPSLVKNTMFGIGKEIKLRIKKEIGEALTVSIGIAPNRYLAKIAAGIHKPDGLDEINQDNYLSVYSKLQLTDLTGIKERNALRLSLMGINSVLDFYKSPIWKLKAAFHSISGYYWFRRLRGYEIDDVEFARRSYGNSFALPKPLVKERELLPILSKLVEKMGSRLRAAGFKARGIHLAVFYRDGSLWHKAVSFPREIFDSRDFFKESVKLLAISPRKPVRNLAVSCFSLLKDTSSQLALFENVVKREMAVRAIDKINDRWGSFVVRPARMIDYKDFVFDRIAFGGVKELEEFTLRRV